MSARGVLSPAAARVLNFLGLAAMVAVLLGAYAYEFFYRDVPCTLCQLQRLAMVGVAFGALMNVVRGPDPRHYGVCLVAAVAGGAVSVRQTALHINPFFDTTTGLPTLSGSANPPFGPPVFGVSLYVWGIMLFATVILAVGVVQLFRSQFAGMVEGARRLDGLAVTALGLLLAIATFETLTTVLECGFGECPNNGGWVWTLFG